MTTYTIQQGDDWSVIVPVYRTRSNYEMWLLSGATGTIVQYWNAFETWSSNNKSSSQELYISSLFENGIPSKSQILDLTDYTVRYQIRSGSTLVATPTINFSILSNDEATILSTKTSGRLILSLSSTQTQDIAEGNYTGQLELLKGTVRSSAEIDQIYVKGDVTYD